MDRDSVTRPITSAILIGMPPPLSSHSGMPEPRPAEGRRRAASARRSTFPAARPRAGSTPSRRTARATASGSRGGRRADPGNLAGPPDRDRRLVRHHQRPPIRRLDHPPRRRRRATLQLDHGPRLVEQHPPERLDQARSPTSIANAPFARVPELASASPRATNRSAIPRRFSKSRASGVTTVPAATRTSRVPAASASA